MTKKRKRAPGGGRKALPAGERGHKVCLYLSAATCERLEEICDDTGLGKSEAVTLLIAVEIVYHTTRKLAEKLTLI